MPYNVKKAETIAAIHSAVSAAMDPLAAALFVPADGLTLGEAEHYGRMVRTASNSIERILRQLAVDGDSIAR